MLTTSTLCKNLFNQEAKDIFHMVNIKDKQAKGRYIDACLALSMRVCSTLFERDDALFLFSGAIAANEACPLYARRIIQVKSTYHLKTAEERLLFTPDNRFLLLSLFLNTILLSDINNCFRKVFEKTMQDLGIKPLLPQKHFHSFLQDEGKSRERASRLAYNQLFETHMKQSLMESNLTDPIYAELHALSQEDLIQTYRSFRNQKLYTFPTFGMLVFLAKKIKEEEITVILKVKIITKNGVEGILAKKFGKGTGKTPAIVLDGMGTDGSFGISYYRQEGQTCPSNYFRYDNPRLLHDPEKPCFYCKHSPEHNPEIMRIFEERFQKATEDFETLFYVLASDTDVPLTAYPALFSLMQEMQPKVEELGLSADKPLAFSIATAHVNSVENEENSAFFLDKVPEKYVEEVLKLETRTLWTIHKVHHFKRDFNNFLRSDEMILRAFEPLVI